MNNSFFETRLIRPDQTMLRAIESTVSGNSVARSEISPAMQIRVIVMMATVWLWTSLMGCASHRVRMTMNVHRAPELPLERFGGSLGLTVDGSAEARSIVEPEFARLTRARRLGPSVVTSDRAELLLAVDQVRETHSAEPSSHYHVERTDLGRGRTRIESYTSYGTARSYTLSFRWSIVRRENSRALAMRTWQTTRTTDSAGSVQDDPMSAMRLAWRQASAFLAALVTDSERTESGSMIDCEGRCGEGYDAMLAGRLLEAEQHFRAAEQQLAASDVGRDAWTVWHNLALCLEFQGRLEPAATYYERASQAGGDQLPRSYIGQLRIADETQLRAARRELAKLR